MSAYQTVVVGTDGSDSSLRAVDRAGQIAAGSNAKLVIATAYFPQSEDQRAADVLKDEGYKMSGNAPIYAILREARERAKAAGAEALVLTVDAPYLGHREADVRNRFQLPSHLKLVNLLATDARKADLPDTDGSGLAAYFVSLIENSITWKDLEWLKSLSDLPLLIKGVVRSDDAAKALEFGADGIVVSNHGGRQLDTSPATIEALPAITQVVEGRIPVLLDGGVRRGIDVVKALALGAQAVLLGRPILWGLAARGEDGVVEVLEMFRRELDLAMALCGTPTLADIGPDLFG